ncbi:hypothetical protein MNBD_ALPHA12-2302 [hydrothermal vent metagenome]|uniref:histidine kinase n=1 Tax=hydrothermal vent metagenome TaxID=652676 RepID=A0A3B0TZ87_9ZZZZ
MKLRNILPVSWPVSLKIPLTVAVLMIAIGTLVTERVLSSLSQIQDQYLNEISGSYLDGLTTSVLPYVLRDDIWEAFDAIERSNAQYENIKIISTIVAGSGNTILAASDPGQLPTGSLIPKSYLESAIAYGKIRIVAGNPIVRLVKNLEFQGQMIGKLVVTLDVSEQLSERNNVRLALIGTSAIFTILMAAFGYLLTRRMTRPMQILSEHLDQAKDGSFLEISATDMNRSSKEISALFDSYNSMIRAVNERDTLAATLHEEEKLAGLGRLTAAMAHEINNPLGGMLNVLETLKRHRDKPEIQKKSINLLERGLKSIGDVVQTALATYRNRSTKRNLCEKDFNDLKRLLRPEINRRCQNLAWKMTWRGELGIDGTSVRQVTLNLLLNASNAAGRGGSVSFSSSTSQNMLHIIVENSGAPIPDEILQCLNENRDKKKILLEERAGLGLWVICRLVQDMSGQIKASNLNDGALVVVDLMLKGTTIKHAA